MSDPVHVTTKVRC